MQHHEQVAAVVIEAATEAAIIDREEKIVTVAEKATTDLQVAVVINAVIHLIKAEARADAKNINSHVRLSYRYRKSGF